MATSLDVVWSPRVRSSPCRQQVTCCRLQDKHKRASWQKYLHVTRAPSVRLIDVASQPISGTAAVLSVPKGISEFFEHALNKNAIAYTNLGDTQCPSRDSLSHLNWLPSGGILGLNRLNQL